MIVALMIMINDDMTFYRDERVHDIVLLDAVAFLVVVVADPTTVTTYAGERAYEPALVAVVAVVVFAVATY